jgi:hypothetical protein
MSETDERPAVDAETVFIVYKDATAGWMATNDFKPKYNPHRPATPDDMVEAASIITQDIGVEKTASRILTVIQQQAQVAMAEAQKNASQMRTTDGGLVIP